MTLINCISGHIVSIHISGDIMNSILKVIIDHPVYYYPKNEFSILDISLFSNILGLIK